MIAATAPARVPAPSPTPEVAPEPWQLIALPDAWYGGRRIVAAGAEPDGAMDFTIDGMRGARQGDAIRWAPDVFFAPIVAYARGAATSWWFATEDGGVYATESFLGTPRLVATATEARFHRTELGAALTGALLVRDERDALWRYGADATLRRLEPVPRAAEMRAQFLDGDRGVLVADGRAFRTFDGGVTFRPINLGRARARNVGRVGGRIAVDTTAGLRVFDAALAMSAASPPARWNPSTAQFEAGQRLHEEMMVLVARSVAEHPVFGPLVRLRDGAVLSDGTVGYRTDTTVRHFDGDRLLASLTLPSPDCRIDAWGPQLVAFCSTAVLRATEGHSWAPVAELLSAARDLSSDGSSLAVAVHQDDGTLLIRWIEGRDSRDIVLPGDTYLSGVWRDQLLLSLHSGPNRPRAVYAVLSARPGSAPQEVQFTGGLEQDEGATVAFAPDGTLRATSLARSPRGRSAWNQPGADRVLARVPEPEGAFNMLILSGRRAIAYGATYAQLWITEDGGAHWTSAAMPINGDASSVDRHREGSGYGGREPPLFRCTPMACLVGRRLAWVAPRVAAAISQRIHPIAVAHAPAVTPQR